MTPDQWWLWTCIASDLKHNRAMLALRRAQRRVLVGLAFLGYELGSDGCARPRAELAKKPARKKVVAKAAKRKNTKKTPKKKAPDDC